MGRARGYSASHAATSADQGRFDAVLGARRGSASAQATRDAQENQTREDALAEMSAKLRQSGSGTALDLLAAAYRSGGAIMGTPEYEKLRMDLLSTEAVGGWELANVAAYGDPEHWPGLTAPAVDVLGTHLQETADGGEAGVASKVFRAQTLTNAIWAYGNSLERYERLAPALEGLAALLHHLPSRKYGVPAARPMAEMLENAPTQALAGPLQPLVQAFRKRILDGRISFEEREILERIVEDQALKGQVDEAFRPVADVL